MPRHPISFVSQSTGLTTHVVRVWERRYGAVTPTRTETNRRLYSDADIDRLRLLSALSESGHSIGSIARYGNEDLRGMLRGFSSSAAPTLTARPKSPASETVAKLVEGCQEAVLAYDAEQLSERLSEATVKLSQPVLLEELVSPLMQWIGEAWHEGTLRVAQEHLASSTVKSFLFRLKQSIQIPQGARVIAVATPTGESHEIGALMASVTATSEGWRPLYFGANLPAAELANAAAQSKVAAVALSLPLQGDRSQLIQEVRELRQFLPEQIPLIVGGAGVAANRLQIEARGIHCVDSLSAFQLVLRKIA